MDLLLAIFDRGNKNMKLFPRISSRTFNGDMTTRQRFCLCSYKKYEKSSKEMGAIVIKSVLGYEMGRWIKTTSKTLHYYFVYSVAILLTVGPLFYIVSNIFI
jgi:hypothetical protein